MEHIQIRPVTTADAEALLNIYRYYVERTAISFEWETPSLEEFRVRIANTLKQYPYLAAVQEGRIAGYAYAHHWQPDPVYAATWELTMYLDHENLGLGIGSAMLRRLIDDCRRQGAHVLLSCVTEGNAACESMCRRAGFTRIGSIPETGYKFGRYLNDVIYTLLL